MCLNDGRMALNNYLFDFLLNIINFCNFSKKFIECYELYISIQ